METLWRRLLADRPGMLGQPWFYVVLIGVYAVAIAWLIIQAVRVARHPEADGKIWRWVVPLALVTLLRGGVYIVLNPTWYSPDEPSHFEYARLLHDLGRVPKRADVSAALQGEIIASMYQFDFWRLNGMETPEHAPSVFRAGLSVDMTTLPRTFVIDDEFLWYYPQVDNEPPLYYYLMQPAFWRSRGDVLLQFYQTRWLTVLLYTGCVLAAFWIGRYLLRDLPGGAGALAAWIALHPMMGYMGASVNNDILGALSALFVFALLGAIFVNGWTWPKGLALAVVLLLALFAKKTTLFLFPLGVFAGLLYLWRRGTARRWMCVALGLVGLGILVGLASLWIPMGAHADDWIARPDPRIEVRRADCAYEGSYGFVLPQAHTGAPRLVQSFADALDDLSGKTLVAEAMVRSPVGAVELALADDAGRHVAMIDTSADWQLVRVEYTLPATATFLRLNVSTTAAKIPGQPICVDAIRLYVDGQPGVNYVRNGSAAEAASLLRTALLTAAYPLRLEGYLLPWFMEPKTEDLSTLMPLSARFAYHSFWGIFGSLSVGAPRIWYDVFTYGSVIAAVGLLGFYVFKARTVEKRTVAYSVVLLGGVLLNWVQIFVPLLNRPSPSWLPQGRFLFPVSAPMLGLLYLGASAWLPQRLRPWLAPFLIVVMLGMDSWILATLVRHSYLG